MLLKEYKGSQLRLSQKHCFFVLLTLFLEILNEWCRLLIFDYKIRIADLEKLGFNSLKILKQNLN